MKRDAAGRVIPEGRSRYFVRVNLDGTPAALFRVRGLRASYWRDGRWHRDDNLALAPQWDTDVEEVLPVAEVRPADEGDAEAAFEDEGATVKPGKP